MRPRRERDAIYRTLAAHGVPRDGVLLVHSAFRQFGLDGYDADAILDALSEYMEPGTLLLPTMSWRFVKPAMPFFDELTTPSNTGVLTEKFRTRLATHRSLHPTHSVAGVGALAEAILGRHHLCETPCGAESPFGLLGWHDAHVVMLGISMDCCTLVHHVEEMMAEEIYVRPASAIEDYTCRRRDGTEVTVRLRRHLFLPRDYWQFQDVLASRGLFSSYRIDNSISRHFRAMDLIDVVSKALKARPDAVLARPGQRYRMM